jgi:hypothetical protein
MFDVDVKMLDYKKLERQFHYLGDQIPKWVALGMTQTVKEGRAAVHAALPSHISNPTPWTRRSMFFFPAEKDDLRAAVAFKWEGGRRSRREIGNIDAPMSMRRQVFGGKRELKGHEKTLQRAGISPPGKPYLVPAIGAERNQYGNVPTSFINKVFYSNSRGGGGGVDMKPFSGGAKKSRSRDAKAGIRYFVHPNKKGIYRTVTHSTLGGAQTSDIRPLPVFLFTRQPQYSERFDFFGIVNRSAAKLEGNVIDALDRGTSRYLRR